MWSFDPKLDTWVFGFSHHGCGVFLEEDQKWYGNVVHKEYETIFGIGPFDSKEAAMEMALQEFNRLESST